MDSATQISAQCGYENSTPASWPAGTRLKRLSPVTGVDVDIEWRVTISDITVTGDASLKVGGGCARIEESDARCKYTGHWKTTPTAPGARPVVVDGQGEAARTQQSEYGGTTASIRLRPGLAAGTHAATIPVLFQKSTQSGCCSYLDCVWPPKPQEVPGFHVAEQFIGIKGKYVEVADTIRGLKEIVEGKHDEIPEQAFYMKGPIEEVLEHAEELKARA